MRRRLDRIVEAMQGAAVLLVFVVSAGWVMVSGASAQEGQQPPWLKVSENARYLVDTSEAPFFWLGDTSWGMTEWLSREDIDQYLDHRQSQGFNVVQICLFWGKRHDDPISFHVNPENAYGFKAFDVVDEKVDVSRPIEMDGGTPADPNDYWDHVEYVLQAAARREITVAMLPVWGRRYVNGTHRNFSQKLFSVDAMKDYGVFLGRRYKRYGNLIWVLGGDVQADAGGDFRGHYRAMAEGIIQGITGKPVRWDEPSELWDAAIMTYHPDGSPMLNSSKWFHKDPWLDFNMIETFTHVNDVYDAVQQDFQLTDPIKPTVLGEPGYEGVTPERNISGLQMRRQAYQSLFAGAAGFTYGAYRDAEGNGPLFTPFGSWRPLLNLEGAQSMQHVKLFCQSHGWPAWTLRPEAVRRTGVGERRAVAVRDDAGDQLLVYCPDESPVEIDASDVASDGKLQWFDPRTGRTVEGEPVSLAEPTIVLVPPATSGDAIAVLPLKPRAN